jgi:hypothetical protein
MGPGRGKTPSCGESYVAPKSLAQRLQTQRLFAVTAAPTTLVRTGVDDSPPLSDAAALCGDGNTPHPATRTDPPAMNEQ